MNLNLVECANCESAQFLQITKSRVYFDDPEDSKTISEILERYECTMCGGTGLFHDDGEVQLQGDVQRADSEVPA